MKKITLLFTIMFVMALTGIAYAGSFTITNNTGSDIHELHVSPTHTDHWGSDLLDGHVFKTGESGTINWDSEGGSIWDIQVKDSQENPLSWSELNLSGIKTITLNSDHRAILN